MQPPPPAAQSQQLTALTSIRFFAAIHILLFHVYEGHRMASQQEQGVALEVFDSLPQPAINWLRHGYFSTSLFFLISGFILAYLYVQPDGSMSRSKSTFWIARAARVYPLHILLLGIAAPLVVVAVWMGQGDPFDVAASGLLSAALLQAWFPPYALSWNFPTWALSTVAFFYLAFPYLVGLLNGWSPRWRAGLLGCLPLVSLVPSLIYLAVHPDGGKPLSFWHEFVMRTPLLWIPHFLMGMLLSILWGINRHNTRWQERTVSRIPWGDLAFVAVFLLSLVDTGLPSLLLRHGLLAPLYLVFIYDLAKGRGVLVRFLSLPGLKALGDASFSIFMLQFPVMILGMFLRAGLQLPSTLVVVLIVCLSIGLSLLSTRFFEKPVSRMIRRWCGAE